MKNYDFQKICFSISCAISYMTKRYYQKYNCRSICILHKNTLMLNNYHVLSSSRLSKHFIIAKVWHGKRFYYGMYLDYCWKKISSRTHSYHQKYLGRVLTLLKAFQLAQGVKYFYYCRIYQISASIQILSTYFWKKV